RHHRRHRARAASSLRKRCREPHGHARQHRRAMPRISTFYGIAIWVYHDESHHRGRPHFHATYADQEATIDIDSLAIIAGGLPPRARRLVSEWARSHQVELRDNWARARNHQPLEPIEP